MLIFKECQVGWIFWVFLFVLQLELGICLLTGQCPPSAAARASGETATTLGARSPDTDCSETDHVTASLWEGQRLKLPHSFQLGHK